MYSFKNKHKKIIDVTGIELKPGNKGKDCKGNGTHFDKQGNPLECCCDECNYMMICFPKYIPKKFKQLIKNYIK